MKVFTRCGVCGKEGEPVINSGSGGMMQGQIYSTPPSWRAPVGWLDVLGVVVCGDCAARVREAVRGMAPDGGKT